MRSRIRMAWIAAVVVASWSAEAAYAQSGFPFDHELLLDAAPMKGSKHVPSLDIAADGSAEIAMWCNTVKAQLVVAGNTITVIAGPSTEHQCPADRLRGDEDLLQALTQATNWRLEGEALVLTGGKTLRFRLQTN
jgi:heat shock protein HslJ